MEMDMINSIDYSMWSDCWSGWSGTQLQKSSHLIAIIRVLFSCISLSLTKFNFLFVEIECDQKDSPLDKLWSITQSAVQIVKS